MGLFDGMKIKKFEQNGQVDELADLMSSKSQATAWKACEAFLRTASRVPKLSEKAQLKLKRLTKAKHEQVQEQAWKALLRTGDPNLMEDIVAHLEKNNNGPVAKLAYSYFDEVRQKEPDRLRASMVANQTVQEQVLKDLEGNISLKDPQVQRAYRFVELFGMWQNKEIAELTMGLIEGNLDDADPRLVDLLMDAMVRVYPKRMTQFLIKNWEENFRDVEVAEKMVKRIKGIGKPAIPLIMKYIAHYRSSIETQRKGGSSRTPDYEVSRWCIYLLGELSLIEDPKIMDFLSEIAVDTKLADTGPHRKNAREALEKIRKRVNLQAG